MNIIKSYRCESSVHLIGIHGHPGKAGDGEIVEQKCHGVTDVVMRHSADADSVEKINADQANTNVNQSRCGRLAAKFSTTKHKQKLGRNV